MSLAQPATASGINYEATPLHKSKKKDLMVISEMTSHKVIGFLMYRHRVGLLAFGNVLLVSYIAWDKIGRLFF